MKKILIGLFLLGSIPAHSVDKETDSSAPEIFKTVITLRGGPGLTGLHVNHLCTGAIISHNKVVTAAHCFEDLKVSRAWGMEEKIHDEHIALWSSANKIEKLYKLKPENIKFHSGFSPFENIESNTSDIAIITIDEDFPEWVVPAQYSKTIPAKGRILNVAGAGGRANRGFIQTTQVEILSNNNKFYLVSKDRICVGDSGGPLFLLEDGVFHLYGVLSYIDDWSGFCGNKPVYTFANKLYDDFE